MRSSGGREHWRETKRSIKDARYRLSLQRNSLNIDAHDTIQLRSKSKSLPIDDELTSNIHRKDFFHLNNNVENETKYTKSRSNSLEQYSGQMNGHKNLVFIEDSQLEQVING